MANLPKRLLASSVRKLLAPNSSSSIMSELSILVSEPAICVVRRLKTWRGTNKICTVNKKNPTSAQIVEKSSRQNCNWKGTTTLCTFSYETSVMNVTNGSQWLTWKLMSEKFTDLKFKHNFMYAFVYLWQDSRMRLGVTAKVGQIWKWSNGVKISELGIFWCISISITNNVESCTNFNDKAQMADFSVLARGRRPLHSGALC